MDEAFLWTLRIIVVAAFVVIAVLIFSISRAEDQGDRERFQDADQPFLKQKKEIGESYGPKSVVPRWQYWLGMTSPFWMMFLLVGLLSMCMG